MNGICSRRMASGASVVAFIGLLVACCPVLLDAHAMTGKNATFVEMIQGPAIGPFIYLGAKHMVTGYDHLMFLEIGRAHV